MSAPRRVLVFCGSSAGQGSGYLEAARDFGASIAAAGFGLVYGGASVGLMGAVADAALDGGAEVIGVIPRSLQERELAHTGLSDLRIVETMHERKALMLEVAGAAVALPGGAGTLDELFEAVTWAQLGIHRKPIGLLEVDGYWRGLLDFLDHAVSQGFLSAARLRSLIVETDPQTLLTRLAL